MERARSWRTAPIGEEAWTALARELPPSAVWSLLLELLEERARQRTPATLMQQWQRDGFVQPCAIDQRTLVDLDRHLLAAAADFEALELSPLAPLGVCSAVAVASQNKVVSALRGTEVVADPTNVLALECARRLRRDADLEVRLATCQRCVRAQALPDKPGFAPHFRIFALASAARERQDHAFAAAALAQHVSVHLAALDRLERHGYAFPGRRLRLLATPARAALAERVAAGVRAVPVERAGLEHAYYDGLRFQVEVRGPHGEAVPLIDGGLFDWLGKLTSNRRFVLVASGMGSQLAAYLFRLPGATPAAWE